MALSMSKKILDYARERNDFFCIHEASAFFNNYDFAKLSALISNLRGQGKLTMTDIREPCKMQSMRHHYYIYNKRQNEEKPKIDNDGNDNFKPRISKDGKDLDFFKKAKETVLRQTGEFCTHTIAKEMNKSPKELESYLRRLKEKRKLKYIGKKQCGEGKRIHKFYILVNKNMKNMKLRSKDDMKVAITQYQKWKDRVPVIKKMMNEGKTDREIGDFFGSTRKAIVRTRQRYKLHRTSRTIKIIQKPIKIEKTEGDLGVFISCLSCGMNYIGEKEDIMNKGFTSCPKCQHKVIIGA